MPLLKGESFDCVSNRLYKPSVQHYSSFQNNEQWELKEKIMLEEKESLEENCERLKTDIVSLEKNIETIEQQSDTEIQELRCQLVEIEKEKQNEIEISETVRNEWKQETFDMKTEIDMLNTQLKQAKVRT